MSFIGVDLGTSFIKGAVLDMERQQLTHIHRVPFPAPLPGLPPLYREFDPAAILAAVRDLLEALLPCCAGGCEGLVMCSQMHGLVLTTAQGEARSNLTTWQDQRVLMPHPSGQGTYFDVMASRISPAQIVQLGNELRAGQPMGLLFWMVERGEPPAPDLYLASLPDFVLANLCESAPRMETTNAMAHGVLNLETGQWHREVIAALGLDGLRWPEIRPHGDVVGHLRWKGRDIPCYTPVGDFQCSITGALLRAGELSLNISTGSQVSQLRDTLEFGNFQTRPFFDGRYLLTITHIPAGRSLTALVRLLSELAEAQGVALPDPWAYVAQAAAHVAPPRLRANLAFFNSSCGDHGEFTNIREEELTVGHLFRAAFENMTSNYYANALRIAPDRGWSNLVFSGGLVQKFPILREMICERFDAPYRICPTSEDTMLGLMALALAFTGRTASVRQATDGLLETYHDCGDRAA
jgi:sugar (pentulose or hexulose) kinase